MEYLPRRRWSTLEKKMLGILYNILNSVSIVVNSASVIVSTDLEDEATPSGEQSSPPVPKTAKYWLLGRNQERIKSTFATSANHLMYSTFSKFHNVPVAILSSYETLEDKAYDRFQKLISQLEIHGAYVSKEDINQKFLRSLPPSWSQIALIMRNKPDIDENLAFLSSENTNSTNEVSTASGDFGMDGDDLEELDLQWQVAMLTVRVKKSGRSQGRRPYGDNGRSNAQTTESSSQALVAQDGLGGYDWSNDFEVEPVNYALMAISSSSSSSSSDSEVQKCSKCLESFKCLQKNYDTEREKHNKAKLEIRGYEIALESLEARILGHEKNELAWGERYEFQNYDLKCREIKINNLNLELEKVVKERDELKLKIEKWEGSSKNLTKILNSQMSAHDKNGLGFGTQMDDLSNKSETISENSLTVFEVRSSDDESTIANDRFTKSNEYHVVPPPITGNPLTPRADISFAGLDEYAFRNKIIESKTTETNKTVGTTNEATIVKPKSVNETVVSKSKINRDEVIIEDWTSDDEDDVCAVKTVSSVKPNVTQAVRSQADKSGQTSQKQGIGFKKVHKIKACFVCKSTGHLIKDYDFYDQKSPEPRVKNVVNTGKRVVKPVWDYGKRVNHQNFSKNLKYPHAKRTFNPSAVLTRAGLVNTDRSNVSTARSISTVRPVRPVSTARPLASKIAQSNSVIRPNHPRLEIVRPKASNSPIKRSYNTQPVYRPKDLKTDVKTFGVKNMTTVGTRAVVSKGKVENVLKKDKWVWRPKMNYQDHVYKYNGSYMLKKFEYGNPEILLQDHAVVDSGCSSHMTCNKAYLSEYEDFNRGFVAFGSDPKGEAVNTDLHVLNRVFRTKPQNKTPYELLIGKFDGKSDEGYLLGYSTSSKAFRVYNKMTKRVEENLHINFLEDQPNVAGTTIQDSYVAGSSGKDKGPTQEYILLPLQPHKTRIPVKDVVQDAQEQPSANASPDKRPDISLKVEKPSKKRQNRTRDGKVCEDEAKSNFIKSMLAIPLHSQSTSMAEIVSKEAQKKSKAGICSRFTSHN
ncbi:hypothetical protein Tco_1437492 [Tanacetum coccineum]